MKTRLFSSFFILFAVVTALATVLFFFTSVPASFAQWTNCPPANLAPNPAPIVVGQEPDCIVSADGVHLALNEEWSRKVKLEEEQSYWFAASKCARARTIAGEIRDDQRKLIKSESGSSISFCFRVPKTGKYTVSYRVTELRGSYSFAITKACLSKSNCSPCSPGSPCAQ